MWGWVSCGESRKNNKTHVDYNNLCWELSGNQGDKQKKEVVLKDQVTDRPDVILNHNAKTETLGSATKTGWEKAKKGTLNVM